MKYKLSLLALSVLTGCTSIQGGKSITQADVDYAAGNIIIKPVLVKNQPNDCPDEAPWGACFRQSFEITNTGDKNPHGDIEIYFGSLFSMLSESSLEFDVEHINGDLHRITMTDAFDGLAPGETKSFTVDFPSWIVSDTDFFPNYYVAHGDLEAKVIANTVPVQVNGREDISAFSQGILPTENQMKRTAGDTVVNPTALTRFDLNVDTPDTGLRSVDALILPTPTFIKELDDRVLIANGIVINSIDNALPSEQVSVLNANFERLNVSSSGEVLVNVSVKPEPGKMPGSYLMNVNTDRVEIVGVDKEGAFNAVQSLISLITPGQDTIPSVSIVDEPRYDFRSVHLDVSRNFHSKELVFKLLDRMSAYKLNKFHFHLSDDEGWRLEIKDIPELTDIGSNRCHDLKEKTCLLPQLASGPDVSTSGSGYYTRDDYIEILQYAKSRNIEVIPSMDMPGHSRAAIKSMEARYDKYMAEGDTVKAEMYLLTDLNDTTEYRSVQNYNDNTINPCIESSYAFIDKVIFEIKNLHAEAGVPLVDYHVGADETAGAWLDSPVCRKLFIDPDSGIANFDDLGKHFIERISHIVDRHGLTLGAWNDGLNHGGIMDPTSLAGEDTKAWVWSNLFWGGAGSYDAYATAGYDVVVSLPDTLYLDMPYEADPKERGYYWATRENSSREIFNFMPDNIPANIETTADRMGVQISHVSGPKTKEFKGIQSSIWSETIRTDAQVEYMAFPRLLATAERAWHEASWEPVHKEGVMYKTNTLEHKGKGTNHLESNIRQRDLEWIVYANKVGYKELPKLDLAGIQYRLPVPGGMINGGVLSANSTYPGLTIEYSVDGGDVWLEYDDSNKPKVSGDVRIRTISTTGRAGRDVLVEF
ncbi:family 20 glycosylhydrolase [Vibrio sp. nBUS_14]|uniref:family 20 glycosylhydrolase n=1 Tax=Vibrio sp. nBUS_14 TaxID=3395321 RepID=UPI003EB7D1F9